MKVFVLVIAIIGAIGAFAAPAAANGICVSVDGTVRHQDGTAICDSTEGGNVAVAIGDASTASATDGSHNRAIARDGAYAGAGLGNFNAAMASGGGSQALAIDGNHNTAVASNDGLAIAGGGDNNTARADDCYALASGYGQTVDCP